MNTRRELDTTAAEDHDLLRHYSDSVDLVGVIDIGIVERNAGEMSWAGSGRNHQRLGSSPCPRGSAWAEAHRSETAEIMRPSMTIPTPRELSQEDMEAALAMQAFIPMAEAARPLLIDQFDQYLRYGLMTVDTPMDATNLVSRIFMPTT